MALANVYARAGARDKEAKAFFALATNDFAFVVIH